jgi:iron complex outermembrane receptor protein
VGGVIHVITKSFANRIGNKSIQINGQVTAGQFGLRNAQAGVFKSDGKTAIGGGIISNNADGQLQRGTRGFFHNHTGSFSLSHHFSNKMQLSFRSAVDYRKFSAQNFYTTFASDTANERVKTMWSQVQLSYVAGKTTTRFSGGFKFLDDRYAFNSVALPNMNKSRLWQALVTNEWKLSTQSVLTTGGQFISRQIASNDRGDHKVDQAAAFAVLNQSFGKYFFVAPALRMEWNERSGWELIPQANISYRNNAVQLRASAGKTIRDADFTERFNNYNKTFVASGRIGNPDLQPERSFSFEVGADVFAVRHLKFSATYFRRDHNNLIDYVPTPFNQMPRQVNLSPTGNYALARNIASVLTQGFEFDVQMTRKIGRHGNVFAAFGYVRLSSNSSSTTPSFYISSHARNLTNFSLMYSERWFSIGLNGLYKEREPQTTTTAALAKQTSAYFIMNAKAEAFVVPQKFSAFIQVDNLFNRNYTDILGSQMPGRWVMGGLRFSLNK